MEKYVLLKGKIIDKWYDLDETAHFHIIVEALEKNYDIAINVGSIKKTWNSEILSVSKLLVYHDEEYNNEILDKIVKKGYGLHQVEEEFALDYLKMNLFDKDKMRLMPTLDTEGTYLIEVLEKYVFKSMVENAYDTYIYGMLYKNGLGIHDIHMNQGSISRYRHRDRVCSDGAMLLHNKKDKSWTALFLAFENQDFKIKK
ncbi:MAG: DUF2278 family protein [Sebaldella sp.]|nr:DUF2278 family protein [Sebaldella sp.]